MVTYPNSESLQMDTYTCQNYNRAWDNVKRIVKRRQTRKDAANARN